jgi:hypothetical protein
MQSAINLNKGIIIMRKFGKIIIVVSAISFSLIGAALAGGEVNSMPEPISMVLLGTALIFSAGFGRKKLKKK